MSWISLPEYARTTGTPESTVRAAIRAGKLRAELEQRAPGDPRTVWRVWYDEPVTGPSSGHPQPSTAPETDQPQSTLTEPPALTLSLLDDMRRLAAENAELRERVGRAETAAAYANRERQRADDLADTLIALRASLSAKEHETEAARAEAAELRERLARRRWWKPSTW